MRVDPFYTSNIAAAIGTTNSTIQKLTNEISSGVRVNSLSDDPLAAGQNEQLMAQLSADDTFTSKTATQTEGMLNVADSTLGDVVSQLTTAISTATEGNTGTRSSTDLKSIMEELTGIRDEVIALANTSYLGQYIFAGGQTSTVPYTGTGTYQGDGTTVSLTTPNGQTISTNLPGSAIFGYSTSTTATGVLGTLNALIGQFSSAYSAGSVSNFSLAIGSGISNLTSSLGNVSSQRITLDNSLSRVEAASTAASTEATQLLAAQTNLMQADLAQIASKLSTSEAQQTALSNVLASLGKKSLFDFLS